MIKTIKTNSDLVGDRFKFRSPPLMKVDKTITSKVNGPLHNKLYMLESVRSERTEYGIRIKGLRKAGRGGYPTYLTKNALSIVSATLQSIRNGYDHNVNVILRVENQLLTNEDSVV